MKHYDYFIGIDPDIEKSGFAEVSGGELHNLQTLPFCLLCDYLQYYPADRTLVVVEASWTTSKNWHTLTRYGSTARAAALGRSVGLNHATGIHLAAMAEHMGFDVRLQPPLKKIGHGRDGKLTHEDAAYYMKGLPARTNQEERDAARLAWTAAGLLERLHA